MCIKIMACGKQFSCRREPENSSNRYTVAVTITGHLPRKISKIASHFLRRRRSICCTVTGGRRHSADLFQGGQEIPCGPLFKAKVKLKQWIRHNILAISHSHCWKK